MYYQSIGPSAIRWHIDCYIESHPKFEGLSISSSKALFLQITNQ
jgi:hypothetical protein